MSEEERKSDTRGPMMGLVNGPTIGLGLTLLIVGGTVSKIAYDELYADGKRVSNSMFAGWLHDGLVTKHDKVNEAARQVEGYLKLPAGSVTEEMVCDIQNGFLVCDALRKTDAKLYGSIVGAFERNDAAALVHGFERARALFLDKDKANPGGDDHFVQIGRNYTYKDMARIVERLADQAREAAKQSPVPPNATRRHTEEMRGAKGGTHWAARDPRNREDTKGHPPVIKR